MEQSRWVWTSDDPCTETVMFYCGYPSFILGFFCSGAATQRGSWPPHSRGFLDHTQRRSTVGRTPLDEWSARRRDLYLTAHNTHNRQISMPPVGFEPTISAGERPQTYAVDRAATGTGCIGSVGTKIKPSRQMYDYPVFLYDYPCLFLSCKANARVKPAKTGQGPHSS